MESLNSIRQKLSNLRARTSSLLVSTADLRLDDQGCLIIEGKALTLSPQARERLAREAKIPSGFFARCPTEMQAYLFNRLYPEAIKDKHIDPVTTLILLDEALVRGIAEPALAWLHGDEVLETALAAKPERIDEDQLEVAYFHINEDFRISIVSPEIKTEPRVDDPVRAGIDICHSDISQYGTRISSYLLALSCTNGMLVRICQHTDDIPSRIRRAAADNRDLIRRRVEEMAQTAWIELEDKLAAIQVLVKERIDNPAAFIRSIGEKLRFPDSLIRKLLKALDDDLLAPTGTQWDIIAAFSRVGTHSFRLSSETRRYLQELSGDLICEHLERCPACGGLRRGKMRYLPRR